MASPGTFISTAGHSGLLVWLVIGWGMQAAPLEMQSMDVSVISGEAFEEMMAARAPAPDTPAPQTPEPEAPQPSVLAAAPQPQPLPSPFAPGPVPEVTPPDPVVPRAPLPDAPATDSAEAQPASPPLPPAPPPPPDREVSADAVPQQADRVAATVTAPPPPDAQPGNLAQEAVRPDENAADDGPTPEPQEATAPEETTTQIVIADLAPTRSVRPMARPSRAAPAIEAAAPQETAEDVNAALAAALAATAPEAPAAPAELPPDLPQGPPMTGAERDSFRVSVNRCWNVDPGSPAARVTVEVGFALNRDGTVLNNLVTLLRSDGDDGATTIAFQAARRAILRCQSGGYQLPPDKYAQWREVVITFDPSGMRMR